MADGREKAFPVSWDQFHRDARALAWRLSAAGPFDAIVAVTRGGLVPAAIVARELELRVIETGTNMTVQTIDAGAIPEGRYAEALGAIAAAHGETIIGSYPSYADGSFRNQIVVRGRDPTKVAATQAAVEAMLAKIRAAAKPA